MACTRIYADIELRRVRLSGSLDSAHHKMSRGANYQHQGFPRPDHFGPPPRTALYLAEALEILEQHRQHLLRVVSRRELLHEQHLVGLRLVLRAAETAGPPQAGGWAGSPGCEDFKSGE